MARLGGDGIKLLLPSVELLLPSMDLPRWRWDFSSEESELLLSLADCEELLLLCFLLLCGSSTTLWWEYWVWRVEASLWSVLLMNAPPSMSRCFFPSSSCFAKCISLSDPIRSGAARTSGRGLSKSSSEFSLWSFCLVSLSYLDDVLVHMNASGFCSGSFGFMMILDPVPLSLRAFSKYVV